MTRRSTNFAADPSLPEPATAGAQVHGTFDESCLPSLADGCFIDSLARYWLVLPQLRGRWVLDLACGKGQGAAILRPFAGTLVQYDLSLATLRFGRQHFPSARAVAVNGDCQALPFFDHRFDCVIAFEIIEHIETTRAATLLAEMKRVLVPGGLAFLSTPNHAVVLRSGTDIPPYHINNLKKNQFRRLLQPHFRQVQLYGVLRRQGLLRDLLKLADLFNLRHWLTNIIKPNDVATAQTDPSSQPGWDGREIPPVLARYIMSRWYVRQAGSLMARCRS